MPGKRQWFIVVTKGRSRPDGTFQNVILRLNPGHFTYSRALYCVNLHQTCTECSCESYHIPCCNILLITFSRHLIHFLLNGLQLFAVGVSALLLLDIDRKPKMGQLAL